ncbi:hypothetical protein [Haladaptatus caseinilyticus]|uniref:hypothetical protein n=1 Tax=Haladaptatus caseinilyticus TaxID=2993314 RepID=UPI00224B9C7D|nr:hypothetical protein [Haladaptatus caseinilyticus]
MTVKSRWSTGSQRSIEVVELDGSRFVAEPALTGWTLNVRAHMSNLLLCPECGWTGSKNDGSAETICPACGADIET